MLVIIHMAMYQQSKNLVLAFFFFNVYTSLSLEIGFRSFSGAVLNPGISRKGRIKIKCE